VYFPFLEYCTPVWSPQTAGNISKVEAVQRRFTKSINGLSSLSYISRLNELSLETLELRRLKQDLVICIKIINGDVDIELNSFSRSQLTVCPEVTNISYSNRLSASMLHAGKFSFANRVCTAWNNLPATVVDSVNVNTFLTRLNTASLSQYCVVV